MAVLPRDRTSAATSNALLTIAALAWGHVVWSALTDDMAGMEMAMTPAWRDGLAYVVAWAVMMAAMMVPSALPMIALYAATQRNARSPLTRALAVALFTALYLALWAATGVPIYFVSAGLNVVEAEPRACIIAGVLLVAGAFQLSSLKQVCLRHCRSPLGFFLGHWRAGWRGGLALGGAHALYCLGCCWALMLVLAAAGAMGLAWVLLIAALVAGEKLLPRGEWIARGTGIALALLGLAVALRPALATWLRGTGRAM